MILNLSKKKKNVTCRSVASIYVRSISLVLLFHNSARTDVDEKNNRSAFFLHINLLKISCGKAGNWISETRNLRWFSGGASPKTHPRLGRLRHTTVLSACVHLHNLTLGSWYEALCFQLAVTKMIVGLTAIITILQSTLGVHVLVCPRPSWVKAVLSVTTAARSRAIWISLTSQSHSS